MRAKLGWLAFPILALYLAGCGDPDSEDCQNAADDDGDGLIDCQDQDCGNVVFCTAPEDCNSVGDEDGNGLADCQDPTCSGLAQCIVVCGDGSVGAGEQCDGLNALTLAERGRG